MIETTRRFSAEITFSGLCLVHFHGCRTRRRPRTAKWVEVLLVNALAAHEGHRHVPRLNYYLQDDLAPKLGDQLVPSPDGQDIVSLDIEECEVDITPPYPYARSRSELTWMEGRLKSTKVEVPKDPYEEAFLDWVLNTDDFGLATLKSDLSVTRVKVPNGRWSCAGVLRNREVGSMPPFLWQLVDDHGTPKNPQRALGTDIRLRLDGLRYGPMIAIEPRKGGSVRQVQLTPGNDALLRFSITNLPETVVSPDERHLPMYDRISDGSRLLSIRQVDQMSCRTSRPCDSSVRFSNE